MVVLALVALINLASGVKLDQIADPRGSIWWGVSGETVGAFPGNRLEERITEWSGHVMSPKVRLVRCVFDPPLSAKARVVAKIDEANLSSMSFLELGPRGIDRGYVLAPSTSSASVSVLVGVADKDRACIFEQNLPSGKPIFREKTRVVLEVDPISVPNYATPPGTRSHVALLRVPRSLSDRFYSVEVMDKKGKVHELSGPSYAIKGLKAIYQYEQLSLPDANGFRTCTFPLGQLENGDLAKVKVFATPFRWERFNRVANDRNP